MSNWIKLSRKILEWEFYDDWPTLKVFLHLLLTASYRQRKWRGEMIGVGEVLTSRRTLGRECHLTEKVVRTALRHLEDTEVIEIEPCNQHSIIRIVNYQKYQCGDQTAGPRNAAAIDYKSDSCTEDKATKGPRRAHERAHEGPTKGPTKQIVSQQVVTPAGPREGQQRAHERAHIIQESNNVLSPSLRSVDNTSDDVVKTHAHAHARGEAIENLRSEIYNSQLKAERAMMAIGVADKVRYLQMCEEVLAEWSLTDSGDVDWKHLLNQLRIKVAAEKRQANSKKNKEEWRQSHMAAAQAALLRIQNRANGIDNETDKRSAGGS